MNKIRTIRVVAAVICKQGRVFATQRGYGDYKDWWEFPGGKVEPGETEEEALIREIREELDADITVDRYITTVEYDYPEFHLSMACYLCRLTSDHLALLEHEAAKWVGLDELDKVKWLPADVIVAKAIKESEFCVNQAGIDVAVRQCRKQTQEHEGADVSLHNGCGHSEEKPGIDTTLRYYREHAEEFAAGTINADMEEIRVRFLVCLPAGGRILDFGCGTGRDTKAFRDLGYETDALDGSEALCQIAEKHTGAAVRCLDFRDFSHSEGEMYDGIWACASLLHLKKQELLPVMRELGKALRSGGVMYASFKYGEFEGERNGRFFTDFTPEGFREFIKDIPEFEIEECWVTGDVRPGRGDERWLNLILNRN